MTITVGTKIKVTDTQYPSKVPNGSVMTVTYAYKLGDIRATLMGGDGGEWYMDAETYEVLESDTQNTPTLWKDMTPEEKGALLLAHHEGKTIEWNGTSSLTGEWTGWEPCSQDCLWDDYFHGTGFAYRIAPEPPKPVVETVTQMMYCDNCQPHTSDHMSNPTHYITFDTIDGTPQCDTIKMVEV